MHGVDWTRPRPGAAPDPRLRPGPWRSESLPSPVPGSTVTGVDGLAGRWWPGVGSAKMVAKVTPAIDVLLPFRRSYTP
jgi:hypothetical protein